LEGEVNAREKMRIPNWYIIVMKRSQKFLPTEIGPSVVD